jgi:hypothetical protein
VLVLADAGNWSMGTPGLTCSLRGLAERRSRVRARRIGAQRDGRRPVPDPVLALARLATLVDEPAIPPHGCFDDYRPPTAPSTRLAALPGDLERLRQWGVRPGVELAGAPGLGVGTPVAAPAIAVIGFDSHRRALPTRS